VIKRLKDTLNNLSKSKESFYSLSVESELVARTNWAKCAERVVFIEKENSKFKNEVKNLSVVAVNARDNCKDSQRELRQYREKAHSLEKELVPLKEALANAEKQHTEVACALASAEGRSNEATKQAEQWRHELTQLEAQKSAAIKDAESTISSKFEEEVKTLRDQNTSLKSKMEARDEELGRLVGDMSDDGSGANTGNVTSVKLELDRLKQTNNDLESKLALKDSELSSAKRDAENATRIAEVKDSDFQKLMMSIGDIQKSGLARESEANELRRVAETKAFDLEKEATNLKHEVSTLTTEKNNLKNSLDEAKATLKEWEGEIAVMKAELNEFKGGNVGMQAQLKLEQQLREKAEEREKEEKNERVAMSAQMMAMTQDHARQESQIREELKAESSKFEEKEATLEKKVSELESGLEKKEERIKMLEGEASALKETLNSQKSIADSNVVEENGKLRGELEMLKERLKNADLRSMQVAQESSGTLKELEQKLREGETARRKMHNVIQELRGNVRVFARIRPFLPSDGVEADAVPIIQPTKEFSLAIGDGENKTNFNFDKVFAPSTGQDTVFSEVSEFVQSALDGYNVCLFSYGQTGSGKTHSMQGSGTGQMRGIIPRAIEQVGKYKTELEADGWQYEMKVSFLEIYNEKIRDLLRDDGVGVEELKH